jgi:hypothetical protein
VPPLLQALALLQVVTVPCLLELASLWVALSLSRVVVLPTVCLARWMCVPLPLPGFLVKSPSELALRLVLTLATWSLDLVTLGSKRLVV